MSRLMGSSLLLLVSMLLYADSLPVAVHTNENPTIHESNETFLSEEDFEAAKHLSRSQLFEVPKTDPSLGNLTEGDIAIEDIEQFVRDSNQLERNAVRNRWQTWTDGVIPYTISTEYSSFYRAMIAKAMDDYHQRTCIRFVPRNPAIHQHYVAIFPGNGCYSYVGKYQGRQPLSLSYGCFNHGIILHELMHAAGFFHEQSRADRDQYISILWHNIRPDYWSQFRMYSLFEIDHLEEKYDYGSVMHYGPTAFGMYGQQTIVPYSPLAIIGQRMGFSDGDVRKLNKLYNCQKYNNKY